MNTENIPAEKAAATGSGLLDMVAAYHASMQALQDYRKARYKRGQFVRVNDDRFHGVGMVCVMDSSVPPHVLPVKLENGNTWWYPLTSIVEIVAAKNVPRSVRRMKLRWHGYKLEAAA